MVNLPMVQVYRRHAIKYLWFITFFLADLVLAAGAVTQVDALALGVRPVAPANMAKPFDLWERIRSGARLLQPSPLQLSTLKRNLARKQGKHRIAISGVALHPRISTRVRAYLVQHDYLTRIVERAEPYLHHIVEALDKRGMPLDLAFLPMVESAYQPTAFSPKGAAGLWQFIPSTGKRFGLDQNRWYDQRLDIIAATDAALHYLSTLQQRFHGDWLLAMAAYNCGEGTVDQAIARNRVSGRATDFWSLNLPAETEDYVPRVLALSHIFTEANSYRLALKPIPNVPYLMRMVLHRPMPLNKAAKVARLSPEKFRLLNPGFRNAMIGQNSPHIVLVPQKNLASLVKQLKANNTSEPLAAFGDTATISSLDQSQSVLQAQIDPAPTAEDESYYIHRLSPGETLEHIARMYNISIKVIRAINDIKQHQQPRHGQKLLIPVRQYISS